MQFNRSVAQENSMNTVATASTAVASTNPPSFRTYGDSDRPAVELHHEDIDLPDYQRVKCVGQGAHIVLLKT